MPARPRLLSVLLAMSVLGALSGLQSGPVRADEIDPGADPSVPDPRSDTRPAEAGDDDKLPVTLTADQVEYEAKREVYVARGNVVIVQGNKSLEADWIAFNPDTGAGVASGNVEIKDGEETLRANFVEFNIDNLEGVIQDGELDSPASRFRAEGAEIQKTGEKTYHFEEGVFTTCRCPEEDDTDPWQIRAEEADIEIDGYGKVKGASVSVLDWPVLWLPRMIFPIKTERESGFLFPDLAIGTRGGFEIGLPFFWAARENVNVTLTPGWSTKRGFSATTGIEYLAGRDSEGDAFGAYGYDQGIDPNSLDDPFGRDRWAIGGDHDWSLPGGLRFRTDHAFISDNQVPLDYEGLATTRADRYLESTAALWRDFGASGRYGGVGSAFYADDLQNPTDIDRDGDILNRLPELQLSALAGGIPGLPRVPWMRVSLDADYIWFGQTDRSTDGAGGFVDTGVDGTRNSDETGRLGVSPDLDPDRDNFDPVTNPTGTEGDGRFQEGELITDRGHRVMLQPRLAIPFRISRYAEVYSEVGWHQTFYDTLEKDTAQRGLLTGRVDLRSRLRKRYGEDIVHVVEPLLGWAYVSGQSQSSNPLLLPGTALPQKRLRDLAFDNLTRDPADRIDRVNRLRFGVTQRVLGAPGEEAGRRTLRADVTLQGVYDFESSEFGGVLIDGRVAPWRFGSLRFHATLDPEEVELDEALLDYDYSHRDGHGARVDYRFLRNVANTFEDFGTSDRFDDVREENRVHQLGGRITLALTRHITASYRMSYSIESGRLVANQGQIEYLSKCGCWTAGIQIDADRARGVGIKFLYSLVGLGKEARPNRGGFLDW